MESSSSSDSIRSRFFKSVWFIFSFFSYSSFFSIFLLHLIDSFPVVLIDFWFLAQDIFLDLNSCSCSCHHRHDCCCQTFWEAYLSCLGCHMCCRVALNPWFLSSPSVMSAVTLMTREKLDAKLSFLDDDAKQSFERWSRTSNSRI